jgi:hypothetical protein
MSSIRAMLLAGMLRSVGRVMALPQPMFIAFSTGIAGGVPISENPGNQPKFATS